jgi:HTH-type transcriptional repressor of NAD biosynthesis genes
MNTGLVLGKFYPLHTGHIDLINFALPYCDELIVLLCASDKEALPGELRLKWIKEKFKDSSRIKPFLLHYEEHALPNTSISSKEVSKLWADKIKQELTNIDIVFSSEQYGEYLAQYLNCQHINYDLFRVINPISATAILGNPLKYWNEIAPAARAYFVKKVCISGTESTGKSTLTQLLAKHFETDYVAEMARDILEHTDECTEQHLLQIAKLHARTIEQKLHTANKLLFVDTDINITRSYSNYLFNKELPVELWIDSINEFGLYLFLDNDAPYVQDGTRLDKKRRDDLDLFHRNELLSRNIKFEVISGSWNERLEKAIAFVNEKFGL